MKVFKKIMNGSYFLLTCIISIMIVVMLIIMSLEVVRRYLFGLTWSWSEEVVRYLLIYVTFLGGAAAFRSGSMVSFDLVLSRFPQRVQDILSVIVNTVCLVFIGFILVLGFKKVITPNMISQVSPSSGIAMWIPYASIPIGMFFLLLYIIENYSVLFQRFRQNRSVKSESD
ncbi:MAG: TRAP transporter small permease [Peptococcaceae bacterium]|jgi:TRAP-type C4-dicarboxylate transport system permease small subunit|nr:TRAP transporter small permease [Peptococcaceae bacterium]MDH7523756.1 TRAP transporter small permease [Peptococcaceae bacterium]